MPNVTGRPGCRTTEMNGGSSAPYLARTPCVPLVCTSVCRGGNRSTFRLPGAGIISIVRWSLRPVIFGVEKINFLGPETARLAESSCPPSKACLPWVSQRGIWDVRGILKGPSVPLTGGPFPPPLAGGSVPLTGLFRLFNCRFRAWCV